MTKWYLFADESGDLQFTRNGQATRFFAVGTLLLTEAQLDSLRTALSRLRDELAWRQQGLDDCFHASTNSEQIRAEVFARLAGERFQRLDVTLLDKPKAEPKLYSTEEDFFQHAWYYHLKYIGPYTFSANDEVLIVAASIGTKKGRKAFRGAIENVMTQVLPYRVKRTLAFWRDESDFALQAIDYYLWAIWRYHERGDGRHRALIAQPPTSEFDLFASGQKTYY